MTPLRYDADDRLDIGDARERGRDMRPETRAMRRRRQQLSDDETLEILRRGSYGTLAVVGDGGYPYAVPVNYVWHEGHIYLHCATTGHKLDAIAADDRVSFCVVDADDVVPAEFTTYFRSAIAFGRAHVVEDPGEKLASLQALGRKYYPGHEDALAAEVKAGYDRLVMVRVDVERATGKEAIELVRKRAQGAGAGGAERGAAGADA